MKNLMTKIQSVRGLMMKTGILPRGIVVLVIMLIPFAKTFAATPSDGDKKVAKYSIESVFCSGCVSGLRAAIHEIDGVVSVDVDVEEHSLSVVFEEETINAELLMERITKETTFELMILSVKEIERDEG